MPKEIYDLKVIRAYSKKEAEDVVDKYKGFNFELIYSNHLIDDNKNTCYDLIFQYKTTEYFVAGLEDKLNTFRLNSEINKLRYNQS